MAGVARAGLVFLVLYVAAFVLALGELLGSFADGDHVFIERFAGEGARIRDIGASYLLALAAVAFAWFVHETSRAASSHRAPLQISGYAAAAAMLVAAVAAATTAMSVWFGAFVDDPGIQQGQGVLPQFAYVALAMGSMLPAGVFMIVAARTPALLPRWLSYGTYPVAVLVSASALLFMPLFLFPLWMTAVTVVLWRPRTDMSWRGSQPLSAEATRPDLG